MEGQPDTDTQQPNDPAFEAAQDMIRHILANIGSGSTEKMQNLLVAIRECGLAHSIGSLDAWNHRRVMRLLAAGPRAWFIAAHADDYAGSLGHSEEGYGTVEFAAELADKHTTGEGYWKRISE